MRMRFVGAVLAVTVVVGAATAAFAQSTGSAVLVTAPAAAGSPYTGGTLSCTITNVANGGVASVNIVDFNGEILFDSGPVNVPGQTATVLSNQGTGTGAFCRFTVSGTASQWRAAAIYGVVPNYRIAIPAF